jgi:hypothetical protein
MTLLCHCWGCRPPLTASHIHTGHIWSVLALFKDVCGHTHPPLLLYNNKPRSAFCWWFWVTVECKCKWCCDLMVEAVDHNCLLITSILDIICGHVRASLLCYINKDRSDFGNFGSLSSVNDAVMSWLRMSTTFVCFSHPYWTYMKWFSTIQWCLCAYRCTLTLLHQWG